MDPARRDALATELRAVLAASCPGSRVALRGSLATGKADVYSDIDLAWTVPDEEFGTVTRQLEAVLTRVLPVSSLRSDPALQNSRKRRLLFVNFQGLPLFWRLDLALSAESVADDEFFDLENPAARGDDWSPSFSALANAVAAVKAVLRGNFDTATGLLDRGFARVRSSERATGAWAGDVARLAEAAARLEPATRDRAGEVQALAAAHLS